MRQPGDWIQALRDQVDSDREWRERQPKPWWVRLDEPTHGLFSWGADTHAVARTLIGMRASFTTCATDSEDCVFWALEPEIEVFVARECDMPGLMRCIRAAGLTGTYRRAGQMETVYRFGDKRKE